MLLSLIAAVSENGVIGRGGDLPWRLSADLVRFKQLTMGHAIIMGRKTFASIGRPLPGRKMIVVTRAADFSAAGVAVARCLADAVELARQQGETEAFVIGGGDIYSQAIDLADRIYLTRVHAAIAGDVRFPEVDWRKWRQISAAHQAADAKNEYDTTFQVFERQ